MYATEPAGSAASGVCGVRWTVVLTPGSWVGVRDGAWGGSIEPEEDGSTLTAAGFSCLGPVLEQTQGAHLTLNLQQSFN